MVSGQSCEICQGSEYEIIDAFMYCVACGTQATATAQLEHEDDVGGGITGSQRIITQRTAESTAHRLKMKESEKLRRSTVTVEKTKHWNEMTPWEAMRSRVNQSSTQLHSRIRSTSETCTFTEEYLQKRDNIKTHIMLDTPFHLQKVGWRIASFTALLAGSVSTLIVEMGFPKEMGSQSLSVWQLYLSHCSSAFCDNELHDDLGKCYHTLLQRRKHEVRISRQKLREKAKERKKNQATREDLWSGVVSSKTNENMEMDKEDEEEEREMEEHMNAMFEKFTTKIHMDAYLKCSEMLLSPRILVAILYIVCIQLGLHWVTLSDITRWLREGRIPLHRFILCHLRTMTANGNFSAEFEVGREFPLGEYHRVLSLFVQSVSVPRISLKISFNELIARFLHNLNIPCEMMSRTLAILHLSLPEGTVSVDSMKRQGDVQYGYNLSQFGSFVSSRTLRKYRVGMCFGRVATLDTTSRDVFLTPETKAMAMILLSMKLLFGLDDDREYSMQSSLHSSRPFSYSQWFLQFKMRMGIWRSGRIGNSLDKGSLEFDDCLRNESENTSITQLVSDSDRISTINHPFDYFHNCVPSHNIPRKHLDIPLGNQGDLKRLGSKMDDLYVPLRNVVRSCEEEIESFTPEERKRMDEKKRKILLEDYKNHSLQFETSDIIDKGEYGETTVTKDRCQSSDRRSSWLRLFPCSSGYVQYPRSHFVHRSLFRVDIKGGFQIVLDHNDTVLNYKESSFSHSRSFSSLISLFSLIIGEEPSVLYSAFVLLEMMTVDRDRTNKYFRRLSRGDSVSVCGKRVYEGGLTPFKTRMFSCKGMTVRSDLDLVEFESAHMWQAFVMNFNKSMRMKTQMNTDETLKEITEDMEHVQLESQDEEEREEAMELDDATRPTKRRRLDDDGESAENEEGADRESDEREDEADIERNEDALPTSTYIIPKKRRMMKTLANIQLELDVAWRLVALKYW